MGKDLGIIVPLGSLGESILFDDVLCEPVTLTAGVNTIDIGIMDETPICLERWHVKRLRRHLKNWLTRGTFEDA
jgi:hypothetical protein